MLCCKDFIVYFFKLALLGIVFYSGLFLSASQRY